MQGLKGINILVIVQGGKCFNTPFKQGIHRLLTSRASLEWRICFYPRSNNDPWQVVREICELTGTVNRQDWEIVKPGNHLLKVHDYTHLILCVVDDAELLYLLQNTAEENLTPPAVIALMPGINVHVREIMPLFKRSGFFWVPFGWFPGPVSGQQLLHTRTDLWAETCRRALYGKQLAPPYLEYCAIPPGI